MSHEDKRYLTKIIRNLRRYLKKTSTMATEQFIIQCTQDPLPSNVLTTNTTSFINLSNLFTQQAQIILNNSVYHLYRE